MRIPRASIHWCFSILAAGTLVSCAGRGGILVSKPALNRAEDAWKVLATKNITVKERERALSDYHKAVAEVVKDLTKQGDPQEWKPTMTLGKKGEQTLFIDSGEQGVKGKWALGALDELNAIRTPHREGAPSLTRAGVGVPMVGMNVEAKRALLESFVPPNGQYLPVTAVIDFNIPSTPTLRLYDPRETPTITVGKRKSALSADFMAPAHSGLEKKSFFNIGLMGLIRPERYLENSGLYMLEPYRPDKIPVVFVHGLMSDPHIWEAQVAALMADPEIGPRIQCWYFVYPTGLPIPSNAAAFRKALAESQSKLAQVGTSPAQSKMLLIGHSMGGILSRMQVIDSGDALWKTAFNVPPDQLPMKRKQVDQLKSIFYFNADPDITRAVFIATPHRGSNTAQGTIGRFGSALIKLPISILGITAQIVTLDTDLLNLDGDVSKMRFNSISNLSPQNHLFAGLDQCRIKVPFHTIIGNYRGAQRIEDSTDGVVPYSSSHLKGAESEVMVPSWHGCTAKPETVAEVMRIVRLHLRKSR